MERDREQDDRASRGRRIFDALRRGRVEEPRPPVTATATALEDPPPSDPAPTPSSPEPDDATPRPPDDVPTPDDDAIPRPPDDTPAPDDDTHPSPPDDVPPPAEPDRSLPGPAEDPPPAPDATGSALEAAAETELGERAPAPDPDDDTPPPPVEPVVAASGGPLPGAIDLESRLQAPLEPVAVRPSVTPPPPPQEAAVAETSERADGLLPLPRVIAIANQKGGVGKTTTAVNLGAALAEVGYRVLVVDLDPQGNATTGMGVDIRNLDTTVYEAIMTDLPLEDCVEPTSVRNLFVAPSNMDLAGAEIELVPMFSRELKLRRAIEAIKDDYEFVLIDCPPSLGLLTVNGLASADDVIVPIQCEYYALEGLGQLVNNVNLVRANLNPVLDISGIVLTMYDARTRLADQVVEEVRNHFGDRVFRTVVPRTVRLSEAPSFGQPIIVFDTHSRGSDAYRGLARELAERVEGGAARMAAQDGDAS